jgi:hypothetical protein
MLLSNAITTALVSQSRSITFNHNKRSDDMNRVVESYSNEPPLSDVATFFAASAAQIRIKAHMGFETGYEEGRKFCVPL